MPSRKRLPSLMIPLALLAACSDGRTDQAQPARVAAAGWAAPPRIDAVRRTTSGLTVSGLAGPGARVVLRGADGMAFAASADDAGRFDIRMSAPTGDVLLTPETQTGQDAAPAPDRLLILAGGQGPMALLAPGAASLRLDGAGALGAVDSDGRMLALSGLAPVGSTVRITLDGRPGAVAQADARGRWRATVGPSTGPARLGVGTHVYEFPGDGGATAQAVRSGAGWRLAWDVPAGGRQVTWLPDAQE
jgi:hypothetical protein